ncbi:profilin-like isoform X1 [Biomphalaria glabrata]|uniref:Profilin n=2 Tax=Biomphalaria TaxID=6525 RepID=A0A2C9KRL8_BIOGL|nr:profilin-1-like isoform X1 [Biomphalaria glabrata]KAI8743332.1 profilin-like isoform X1 [Biomphalaria glabrata]KAI8778116.1 profilin isoform X1 [Biomphalaria glabrata]
MSWAAYVTNLEGGKGRCKYAGIWGKQGGVWAESPDKSQFPISAEDVAVATRAVVNQDQNVMGTGLTIAKNKFTCLRMEPEILICQGKGDNKDHSLVIAVSTQAVIIGFNPDPDVKTAQVREGVEGVKDYLKSVGY